MSDTKKPPQSWSVTEHEVVVKSRENRSSKADVVYHLSPYTHDSAADETLPLSDDQVFISSSKQPTAPLSSASSTDSDPDSLNLSLIHI